MDANAVNQRIRKVDADEILDLAQEILDPSRLTLSIVGPNPDEPMLKKLLGIR